MKPVPGNTRGHIDPREQSDTKKRNSKPQRSKITSGLEQHFELAVIASLVLTAVLLIPFMTTINDFLATIAQRTGAASFLLQTLSSTESSIIAAVLSRIIGIHASSSGPFLSVSQAQAINAYIDWNCTGWQSWIVLGVTMLVGLYGRYTTKSKVTCIMLGVFGTFAVNLLRIITIVLVAIYVSTTQALLYHTYGGTIAAIIWLIFFWYISFKYVLKKQNTPVRASK
jgi:exosortase/archaeosortase family protein